MKVMNEWKNERKTAKKIHYFQEKFYDREGIVVITKSLVLKELAPPEQAYAFLPEGWDDRTVWMRGRRVKTKLNVNLIQNRYIHN